MDPDLLDEELADRARATAAHVAAVLAVDLYGQCCRLRRASRSLPTATACRSSRTRPSPRCDVRRQSRRARSASVRRSRSTATRSSRRAAAACSCRTDRDLIERARHLATQARDAAPHYEHSRVGYNYRLSNLLAAVGRGAARRPRREGRRAAGSVNSLYRRGSGRRARHRVHAGGAVRRARTAGSPASPSIRRSSASTAETIRLALEARRHRIASGVEADAPAAGVRRPTRCSAARSPQDLFARGLCLPERVGAIPGRPGPGGAGLRAAAGNGS